MTLTEFLLARIDEDASVARLATQGSPSGDGYGPWRESYDDGPAISVFGYPSDRVIVRAEEDADNEHVIRWQPERVLAECEAKRLIVELFEAINESSTAEAHADAWVATRTVVYALALPYADHPDYRSEWKP